MQLSYSSEIWLVLLSSWEALLSRQLLFNLEFPCTRIIFLTHVSLHQHHCYNLVRYIHCGLVVVVVHLFTSLFASWLLVYTCSLRYRLIYLSPACYTFWLSYLSPVSYFDCLTCHLLHILIVLPVTCYTFDCLTCNLLHILIVLPVTCYTFRCITCSVVN